MKFFLYLACIAGFINPLAAKTALILGITGQDGAYLADFLLEKGYQVHGLKRRTSLINTKRIDHLFNTLELKNRFYLHYGDIEDLSCLVRLIDQIKPDEIYNLAAQSHVQVSFELPIFTGSVDGLGVLNILEAIRLTHRENLTKFYQASSSEMFGAAHPPQNELTPFYPRSPYGVAKLYGYWITKNYRESYRIFAVNGILFNHESPLRGETFVTRKIAIAVARIFLGLQEALYIGNLDAKRDWGHAKDYVEAMWLMMQHAVPDDFVIATGEAHSVREFVELAFSHIGITIKWRGLGSKEVGFDAETGKELIFVDPKYLRPTEVDYLLGDASKAEKMLNWKPKITFTQLVSEMVQAEIEALGK